MRPVAAIVGRPNVGKSMLFNALAGRRIAVTDSRAGTTRDRLITTVRRGGYSFDLIDTGGMGGRDSHGLDESVESQIELALDEADIILMVADVSTGPTPPDKEVARRIRRRGKPVMLVVNKVDNDELSAGVAEFHSLGLGEPAAVSAMHRRGVNELFKRLGSELGEAARAGDVEEGEFRLAVCGRRNSGKSTLVNAWAGSARTIVSDVPGTTRDTVDVHVRRGDLAFVAVDTPGLRRKREGAEPADFYSSLRAEKAVERADVVMLLVDAVQGPSSADKEIARLCAERCKAAVIVVNKWDLAAQMTTEKYLEFISARLSMLRFAPVVFISAAKGERAWDAAEVARDLWEMTSRTASTADVNRALRAAIEGRSPPFTKRGPGKAFYSTQVGTAPPRFAVFVNDPERFPKPYLRYLAGAMADALGIGEVPIRLLLRRRH